MNNELRTKVDSKLSNAATWITVVKIFDGWFRFRNNENVAAIIMINPNNSKAICYQSHT